jgi:hypothetical protein
MHRRQSMIFKKHLQFAVILLFFITTQVISQQAVRESFNYPLGTKIDTLVGDAGNGWGGSWDLFDKGSDANLNIMTVADTGFAYKDLNYPVQNLGNLLIGNNPAAWGYQRYGRKLAQTWPDEAGKVYWLSCLYELKNYTDNGWALVSLFKDNKEGPGIGHEWGNAAIGVATYNDEGRSVYSVHDGPQWLVAKVVMSGDTVKADRVFLWVSPNPAGGEPDTAVADARGNWNLNNGFNQVAIHWGGEGVGMSMAVDEIRLGTSWTAVSSPISSVPRQTSEIPLEFGLAQNYPNPFNPSTTINYTLLNSGKIKLSVFDMLGREVAVLVNQVQSAGTYEVTFKANELSSGIYFYRLQGAQGVITKKMMLLK